jgi:hypothetical protein
MQEQTCRSNRILLRREVQPGETLTVPGVRIDARVEEFMKQYKVVRRGGVEECAVVHGSNAAAER